MPHYNLRCSSPRRECDFISPLALTGRASHSCEDTARTAFRRRRARPFLKNHCLTCHGTKRQEAKLDLSWYTSLEAVAKNHRVWEIVLERIENEEMLLKSLAAAVGPRAAGRRRLDPRMAKTARRTRTRGRFWPDGSVMPSSITRYAI